MGSDDCVCIVRVCLCIDKVCVSPTCSYTVGIHDVCGLLGPLAERIFDITVGSLSLSLSLSLHAT